MAFIYESKGKAKEYNPIALNIYRGCDHGCSYCYAPSVLRMKKDEFMNSAPRKDVVEGVRKEAHKWTGQEILLCFTTDPYQKIAESTGITRQVVRILVDAGVIPVILSKGGMRATADFDILKECITPAKFGTTLTFDNDKDSLEWEPNAATPLERIESLRLAKEAGLSTWVSCEPVIDPQQTLNLIKLSAPYVDMFKVGRWNHDARANAIDWKKFGTEVVDLLEKLGVNYYIKKDLAKYLDDFENTTKIPGQKAKQENGKLF